MRSLLLALAVGTGLGMGLGVPGAAFGSSVVFSDSFNTENGGVPTLNYFGFANWTVPVGSVDLIGNGFFDLLPGNGLYVDMDGSTDQAGSLLSKSISVGAGTYVFSYDLAGSQRGPSTALTASVLGVAGATQTTTSASSDPFAVFSIGFTVPVAQNINLEFQSLDGPS